MPPVYNRELNAVLADQFQKLVQDKTAMVRLVLTSISDTACRTDYPAKRAQLEAQLRQLEEKKDRLLELSVAEAISTQEFKSRNDRFNEQMDELRQRMRRINRQEQEEASRVDLSALEKALQEELDFNGGISTELAATILDHVIVLKNSTMQHVYMDIYLKTGQKVSAHYARQPFALLSTTS